jgi:hypothetical protein
MPGGELVPSPKRCSDNQTGGLSMPIILWLLGVPLGLVIVLMLFGFV